MDFLKNTPRQNPTAIKPSRALCKYMAKQKQLKISQGGHPLITSIFSRKELQQVWIEKADVWLRYETVTGAWQDKLFHYKTSKSKWKYFVIMEVSQSRMVHKNVLPALSLVPKLPHIVCMALYNLGEHVSNFQLDSTLSLCATTITKKPLLKQHMNCEPLHEGQTRAERSIFNHVN